MAPLEIATKGLWHAPKSMWHTSKSLWHAQISLWHALKTLWHDNLLSIAHVGSSSNIYGAATNPDGFKGRPVSICQHHVDVHQFTLSAD